MGDMFVDREEELEFLNSRFDERPQFIVLYGRRRVGKTELSKKFLEDKGNTVYHLVSRESRKDQIKEFKQSLSKEIDSIEDLKEEWSVVLKNIGELDALVIDEFQYLIESDQEILKIFQKAWDEYLSDQDIMLVITGSSVGMMENEVLNYKSPLYGRRTGQWHLKQFRFENIRGFFPEKSLQELVNTYAVLGGTPFYLQKFDQEKNLHENIRENILAQGCVLREEVENLLKQELRKPDNYFSVLKAVANGKNRFNQIQNETGIKKSSLSKYTKRLRNLHIVEKELPVTASEKSKRGRYKIKDNFFDFWFKFVFPEKSSLQQNIEPVAKNIQEQLPRYTGRKFEQVCRQHIQKQGDYNKVGRWWYKEDEIDIAALNDSENTLLTGEVKWTSKKVGMKELEKLKDKTEKVKWKNDQRKEQHVLFSKNGFTDELKKQGEIELYSLKRLENEMT
jgi:AAA+ ATPase superfamily predicted ATPase